MQIEKGNEREREKANVITAQNASQNCLAISQTLAPAVLDPSCKRMIIDSAKAVQSANAQLLGKISFPFFLFHSFPLSPPPLRFV